MSPAKLLKLLAMVGVRPIGAITSLLNYKLAAPGIWNLTTNVATGPDGTTTFTPTSGVYPPGGFNFLLCTGTGTRVLDGNTYSPTDYATMNAALGQWVRSANSGGSIGGAAGAPLVSDGGGNAVAGTLGVNVVAPPLLQCNVPVGIAPSGTVGANGAVTFGTAIVAQNTETWYASGVWLLYPANSITGSNAQGYYWTTFTSQTVAQIWNTTYTPGTNSGAGSWRVPATPTAFSGTTGAAFTGITGNQQTHSISVAGNTMGPNGKIVTEINHRNNNSAGTKSCQQTMAGNNIGYTIATTTNTNTKGINWIENCGVTNRQVSNASGYVSTAGVGNGRSADTTTAQTLAMTAGVAVATDYNIVQSLEINIKFGA